MFVIQMKIYHITEYVDVRTNEIVTFFENSFTWIVFSLITDAKDRSLDEREEREKEKK